MPGLLHRAHGGSAPRATRCGCATGCARRAEGSGDGAPQEGWDFAVNATAAPAPVASAATTERHPWQAFRYVDADVEPGGATATGWSRGGRSDRLEDGAAVELTVATEDTGAEATAVFLNRAAASTAVHRALRRRRPGGSPEARRGGSRAGWGGASPSWRDAQDARFKLHVAVYEVPEARAPRRSRRHMRPRRVEVQVVYHGRQQGRARPHRGENRAAARRAGDQRAVHPAGGGAPAAASATTSSSCSTRGGAPAAVWTGSTNWTDGALYGQLNVGHAVYRADVAGHFERYFQPRPRPAGGGRSAEALDRSLPGERGARARGGPGVWPVFSPRGSLEAVEFYAEVCARARSLMVCAPFLLHEKIRAALVKDRAKEGPAGLRFPPARPAGQISATPGVDLLDARGRGRERRDCAQDAAPRLPAAASRAGVVPPRGAPHAKLILADPLGPDPTVIAGSAFSI